ncbi:hypothetical protein JYU15_00395 [bacterium AH-315-I18]|nr:hypothetical protein [bacterium AH-315-I18]MBN4060872.1 hypothetical protein [bacterium AH-315-I18]
MKTTNDLSISANDSMLEKNIPRLTRPRFLGSSVSAAIAMSIIATVAPMTSMKEPSWSDVHRCESYWDTSLFRDEPKQIGRRVSLAEARRMAKQILEKAEESRVRQSQWVADHEFVLGDEDDLRLS